MSRAGYLHKVSLGLEPSHRSSTIGSVVGTAFFGSLLVAGFWLNTGSWPAGVPAPPVPFPVPDAAVAVLAGFVGLALLAVLVHGRRWHTYRRILRLTADPELAGVLPAVETESAGPFAPLQPAPLVTFDKIPVWGRVRPRYRVTRERNVVGLPPLHIVYLRVFENRARARTFVQGAWREFGYVYLLRSAASVGPAEFRRFARERRLSELVVGSEGGFRARLARARTEPEPPGWHRVRTVAGSAVSTYDRYGAYPVCAPMCAGAFWKRALDILLERADLVVLDLSGYQEHYRGTQFELQRIVDTVPAEKVLLLTDPWSRTRFLTEQIRLAWSRMAAGSPNAGRGQLALRGAVTDYFHREESSSGSGSGSGSSSSRLTLRASRRQTRRLLRDVQQRLPAGRSTRGPGRAPLRAQYPTQDLTQHPAPPAPRAPRWPRVAAALLVVAIALTLLYQLVGGGG
jgi:hypothetical protein